MLSRFRSWLIEEPDRLYLSVDLTKAEIDSKTPVTVVLSRGLCQFFSIDLSDVRKEDRASALRLKVTRDSPFNRSDYTVFWHGTRADVWYWDLDKVDGWIQQNQLRTAGVLPASLAVPVIAEHEIIEFTDGYEARIWRGDRLAGSRWFAHSPSEEELALFSRGVSGNPAVVEHFVKRDGRDAWREQLTAVAPDDRIRETGFLLAVVMAVLAFMTVTWEIAGLAKNYRVSRQVAEQLLVLEQQSETQLKYREAVFSAEDLLSRIRNARPFPTQLELKAHLNEIIPDPSVRLTAWRYNAGRLQIELAGESFDLVSYTRIFDESSYFTDPDVRRGSNDAELVIQVEVLRVFD